MLQARFQTGAVLILFGVASLSSTMLRADGPAVLREHIELPVTTAASSQRDNPAGAPRGIDCPGPFNATHTTTPFDQGGASVFAQGGFLEGEWAAATYVIPADRFPLILEVGEILLASPTITAPSQTQYTVGVWQGNPATGTMISMFSSNGADIPHADHPIGQNVALRVQFQVDPGDPEQIVINNDGSNSFTVGFRVDLHNMQLFGSCGVACNEPLGLLCTGNNMMPSTDTDGQAQPTNNWLFAISCPGLSAGWYNFAQLSGLGLNLSGDWMIQASYRCINEATGACCLTASCVEQTATACDSLGGLFQGNGTQCLTTNCPVVGACCQESGDCSLEPDAATCAMAGGTYQGDFVPCDPNPCPQPGACCIPGGNCLDLTEASCINLGFDFRGVGTECSFGGICPIGACCLPDGTCTDGLGTDECTALSGFYQGDGVQCIDANCPQPTGACCVPTSNPPCFGGFTEFNCLLIPNATWAGAFTFCPDACNADPCDGITLGDYNGDTLIDGNDLALFTAALVSGNPSPAEQCAGDFDNDQQLGTGDIAGMVAALLP